MVKLEKSLILLKYEVAFKSWSSIMKELDEGRIWMKEGTGQREGTGQKKELDEGRN